jgi:hypothetical protein
LHAGPKYLTPNIFDMHIYQLTQVTQRESGAQVKTPQIQTRPNFGPLAIVLNNIFSFLKLKLKQ